MTIEGITELIQRQLGINVDHSINPVASSIATSITQFLRNDPKRIMFVLINLGSTSLYISPQQDVASDKGIFLAASGGTFVTTYKDDLILPSLPWYGISATSANDIYTLIVKLR